MIKTLISHLSKTQGKLFHSICLLVILNDYAMDLLNLKKDQNVELFVCIWYRDAHGPGWPAGRAGLAF